MNYTFKGNFGTLELVVDDNGNASGTYQKGGTLSGTYKDGEFEGEWENNAMEGLVKFTVKEGRLNGKWKKGKDAGPMRGNWLGEQIGSQTPEKEKKVEFDPRDEGWSEAHCQNSIMFGYDKKYPLLSTKDVLGAANMGIYSPIVVFLMYRSILTDSKFSSEESFTFDELSEKYGDLFGFGSSSFKFELMRINKIYNDYISLSEDARMIDEAIEFVRAEFDLDQKDAIVNILETLAISDSILDHKELSILYSVVLACSKDKSQIAETFHKFHEQIIKTKGDQHPMAKSLMLLINLIENDTKNIKYSYLQSPDANENGGVPPMLLSDSEFAEWLILMTLSNALRNKEAFMLQTRIHWSIFQKGLIKFFGFNSGDDKDEQIDEAILNTKKWIDAAREDIGNVSMKDETIFEVFLFADAFQPDLNKEDVWKITCKKVKSGIEIHAFDISRDSTTYWIPENAMQLADKLRLESGLFKSSQLMDSSKRKDMIEQIRK